MLPQVKLNDFTHAVSIPDTVESIPRFSKSIFRNSLFFKPKVVFLGFKVEPRSFEVPREMKKSSK